jgi:phenolic acid decarboxylase
MPIQRDNDEERADRIDRQRTPDQHGAGDGEMSQDPARAARPAKAWVRPPGPRTTKMRPVCGLRHQASSKCRWKRRRLNHVLGSQKGVINMLTSILGARLSWHFANGWVFEPAIVGPDIVDYHLKEGPHAGRHAIQHFYYQRVAPGVETTVWYEESGAVVHMTWYLETQTVHRFAALPAWLGEDMTVYRGDNQDPAFIAKIRKLISERPDWPRTILDDEGFFRVI